MFANGLANPPSPPPSCVPFVFPAAKGLSFGREMLPNPALCSAILVPILLKNDMFAIMRVTYTSQSKVPGSSRWLVKKRWSVG
jgi:hypothetical protein